MDDIDDRLKRIGETLDVQGKGLLFRRGIKTHLSDLAWLRSQGLTWNQIAIRLTACGARHKRGQPISAHNLRTEYGRLAREQCIVTDPPSLPTESATAAQIIEPEKRTEPTGARMAAFKKLSALTRTRVRPFETEE